MLGLSPVTLPTFEGWLFRNFPFGHTSQVWPPFPKVKQSNLSLINYFISIYVSVWMNHHSMLYLTMKATSWRISQISPSSSRQTIIQQEYNPLFHSLILVSFNGYCYLVVFAKFESRRWFVILVWSHSWEMIIWAFQQQSVVRLEKGYLWLKNIHKLV